MSQLNEAIARYHKILESEPYRDLSWVKELQDRMEEEQLSSGGRLLCPFLRPNFVTQRQYDAVVKAGEALLSANYRMQQMALASPRLLNQLELLPAEKMLAAIDPGYSIPEVSAKLDLQVHNGSLHVTQYSGNAPMDLAYADDLADLFYDSPPVKEFRRKYNLTRVGVKKPFVTALLEAWEQFAVNRPQPPASDKVRHPRIALVEFRQPNRSSEFRDLRNGFRRAGFAAEIVSPEQLEYRGGKLTAGSFAIDLVYRRFTVQEFLLRFDLNHALVKAYRDGKVCVVNSFRSEMTHKRAMLALLTDPALTGKFPPPERKAIREHVPWTRILKPGKTTHGDEQIDLLEYVRTNRESLTLKPNDETTDQPEFSGSDMEQADWERAMRQAQRTPYVVQEKVEQARLLFPLLSYGHLEFREMNVDVQPQAYMGKVTGCSSRLSAVSSGGFSTSTGVTPTFIIDAKNGRVER